MTQTQDRAVPAAGPLARPYPISAVVVADHSVFAASRDRMLHLARTYPLDRLLAVFRINAGLDTHGAQPPGNWEDYSHPNEEPWSESDYPGREKAQTANLLRGHYAGHFLSMLSMAYASTGEQELRAKVSEFVEGLGQVQDALAATGRYSHPGFLAAYGEWQFSRLEGYAPYGEIWAPYYTTHKIMAGLLDAYELTGNLQALRIVTAMGKWVHARLSRLAPAQIQKMWSLYIAGEYGGMNETLARLAVAAQDEEFGATAQFFDQQNLLEAGSSGTDILDGMHANQHLPQLVGYVHEYELTGQRRYLDAAAEIFACVVPGRMYAHGGTGESELWGPANTVAGDIGNRNAETCAAYNLLKIARLLFAHTLDPKYMNYAERTVLNQILGSRKAEDSDVSPEVTYMFPVHPGAKREFNNIGTCCGGTGLENHVKYGEGLFHRAAGQLWINHLFPAALNRAGADESAVLNVTVRGQYPLHGAVQIRFDAPAGGADGEDLTVHVRIPDAAGGPVQVLVNGAVVEESARVGEYLSLQRRWHDGDDISVQVPITLRSVPTIDDPSVHSLELGPTVLLARSQETTQVPLPLAGNRLLDGSLRTEAPASDLLAQLAAEGTITYAGMTWEPAYSGQDTRYHMYVRRADATITFAGTDTEVPNRMRPAGVTVLDSIWEPGVFVDRQAFLAQVATVVGQARTEGVLGRDEAELVLITAARADVDGTGTLRQAQVRPEPGDGDAITWQAGEQDSDTVWLLPAGWAQIQAPPVVTVEVEQEAAPSGWYTTTPTVVVRAVHLDAQNGQEGPGEAGLSIEVQIDDGEWQPYTGPFTLDQEGAHQVRARVSDGQGRQNRDERELSIDTEPPESAVKVRELGSSVEVTFAATDEVSGVERIQWEGPGTFWGTFSEAFVRALTDTEQVLEYAATDRAGNIEPRRRVVLPALGEQTGKD
ncbi:beta-L-arabinofuranosidase domain-containing protein [Pseudactinotalea sp. Z1748]|uniref:beta-L-arabinofuranosidase domain-containing protein n=1 Tax=Pseudactinotalea sp. Z1748 TaxID=3413027 RepID=UPI003C7C0895